MLDRFLELPGVAMEEFLFADEYFVDRLTIASPLTGPGVPCNRGWRHRLDVSS